MLTLHYVLCIMYNYAGQSLPSHFPNIPANLFPEHARKFSVNTAVSISAAAAIAACTVDGGSSIAMGSFSAPGGIVPGSGKAGTGNSSSSSNKALPPSIAEDDREREESSTASPNPEAAVPAPSRSLLDGPPSTSKTCCMYVFIYVFIYS
jgi:hypothetical protein